MHQSPTASGEDSQFGNIFFSKGCYQVLGAMASPKEFLHLRTLICEAVSNPVTDCRPSTPSPTREIRIPRSKSCRIRVRRGQPASPKASIITKEEKKDFQQQTNAFRNYLDKFCVQMSNEMWQEKSFSLCIDYNELKSKNMTLAYDIANNYEEIKNSLVTATREFLHEEFSAKASDGGLISVEMLDHNIKSSTDLSFSGMPKSIISLKNFFKEHKTTTRKLFAGHQKCKHHVAIMAPASRNVLGKIVTYVTLNHQDGLTWNGGWTIEDWEVYNGSCVQLRTTPVTCVDRSMRLKDLEGISKEIIVNLTHNAKAGGMYPAYLLDLSQHLRTTETTAVSDTDFKNWYYEFLQYHPALLSSRARSALIKGLYSIAVRLDYNKIPAYDAIFADGGFVAGWVNFVYKDRTSIHDILWKVFWDNKFPLAGTHPNTWTLPYANKAGDLLKMVRHVLEHANRYTRQLHPYTGKPVCQAMKHSCEPELFAADIYKKFLPAMIKLIFLKGKMHGEFALEWAYYKITKDFFVDELQEEMPQEIPEEMPQGIPEEMPHEIP